jgi:hypothetical protein
LDEDSVRFHERVTYGGNTVENAFSNVGGRAGKGSDEVYEGIRTLRAFVDTLEAERHGWWPYMWWWVQLEVKGCGVQE